MRRYGDGGRPAGSPGATADTLLAFLQGGLARLEERGVQADEAMLTCLADAAVVAADLASVSDHRLLEPMRRSLASMLWSDAARDLTRQPGPEAWAILLGRCFVEPRRYRADLDAGLRDVAEAAALFVLDLGPDWRPWEVWAVRRRAGIDDGADPPDPTPILARAIGNASSDYAICHVIIYATDFGRQPPPSALLEAAGPLLATSCDNHTDSAPLDDLGLETLLAHRFLTGRWHRAARHWTSRTIPEFASGLTALGHSPGAFYRAYHPALLAARVVLDPTKPSREGTADDLDSR